MAGNFEEQLLHPKPGSAIESAQKFGIDLTLIIEQLRLTPDERIRNLQKAMYAFSKVKGKSLETKQA